MNIRLMIFNCGRANAWHGVGGDAIDRTVGLDQYAFAFSWHESNGGSECWMSLVYYLTFDQGVPKTLTLGFRRDNHHSCSCELDDEWLLVGDKESFLTTGELRIENSS